MPELRQVLQGCPSPSPSNPSSLGSLSLQGSPSSLGSPFARLPPPPKPTPPPHSPPPLPRLHCCQAPLDRGREALAAKFFVFFHLPTEASQAFTKQPLKHCYLLGRGEGGGDDQKQTNSCLHWQLHYELPLDAYSYSHACTSYVMLKPHSNSSSTRSVTQFPCSQEQLSEYSINGVGSQGGSGRGLTSSEVMNDEATMTQVCLRGHVNTVPFVIERSIKRYLKSWLHPTYASV